MPALKQAALHQRSMSCAGQSAASRYLGGGTNLVDLMRETIERPDALVDVSGLSQAIEVDARGGLRIGAAARNSAVAAHPVVRERFPLIARALLAGELGDIVVLWGWVAALALAAVGLWAWVRAIRKSN